MSDEYEYSGSLEGSESEYDYGSDDGDGYSEGPDDEMDLAVDLENTYYLADGATQLHTCHEFTAVIVFIYMTTHLPWTDQFSEQQYDTALEQFQKVIEMEVRVCLRGVGLVGKWCIYAYGVVYMR